jgi:hypothetical protein
LAANVAGSDVEKAVEVDGYHSVEAEQGRLPDAGTGESLDALRLTDAESDHLHVLAGTAPDCTGATSSPASSRSWNGCRRRPAS